MTLFFDWQVGFQMDFFSTLEHFPYEKNGTFGPSINELKEKHKFSAWVPALIGKLDFSRFTCGLCVDEEDAENCAKVVFNYKYESERGIFLSSVYNWKDVKQDNNGLFRVFLFAKGVEADGIENIQGEIYIIPPEHEAADKFESYKELKKKIDASFGRIDKLSSKLNRNQRNWIYDLVDQSSNDDENIAWCCNSIRDIHTYINSEYFLSSGPDVFKVKFFLKFNGFSFFSEVENLSTEADFDPIANVVIPRQAFYYLKYSIHSHKHHPNNADSVTTIHAASGRSEYNLATDMISDLQRSIIDAKNIFLSNNASNHEVLGMIGYCRSLIEGCYKEGLLDKEQRDRKINMLDYYAQSANAVMNRLDREETGGKKLEQEKRDVFTSGKQNATIVVAILSLLSLTFFNVYGANAGDMLQSVRLLDNSKSYDVRYFLISLYSVLFFVSFVLSSIFTVRRYCTNKIEQALWNEKFLILEKICSGEDFDVGQAQMAAVKKIKKRRLMIVLPLFIFSSIALFIVL